MFRMPKSLDVITLFHSPSVASSRRALDLLKRAQALAQEEVAGIKFDPVEPNSKTSKETIPMPGNEFELEVTENPPTEEQLTTIFDYLGPEAAIPGKPSDLVKEARNQEDAIKKVLENGNSFIRPVVVDWDNGKAVYGGNEPAIIKMLKELPQ